MTRKLASLVIYTDGAARGNPGPAGIGAVISDENGEVVTELSETIGEATNNVAEYTALVRALEVAVDYGASEVKLFLDSELVVKQIKGEYRVKNSGLKGLHAAVLEKLKHYERSRIAHVPRAQNREADRLANAALDGTEGASASFESQPTPGQGKLF